MLASLLFKGFELGFARFSLAHHREPLLVDFRPFSTFLCRMHQNMLCFAKVIYQKNPYPDKAVVIKINFLF